VRYRCPRSLRPSLTQSFAKAFTVSGDAQELIAALSLMRVPEWETRTMDSIIYLVGLVVVIMFVLSLLGLR
jgi:hypothetical protein